MDNPLLGICVSTAVTGLIQSSGATMSILLSLAGQVDPLNKQLKRRYFARRARR